MNIFEQGDYSTPVRSMSTNSQAFLSLHTIGRMFDDKPHGSSVRESGLITCSDDASDEDLDLEHSADKFLSEKFGISLSRLTRPNRIIYAFQEVKNLCADILEDEGHQFVGSPRSEDSPSELVDGGDTYHPTRGDRANSTPGSTFTSAGTKRPNHDTVESEGLSSTGSVILAKTRRYKKRRVGGDLSCPYRKRNPRRFNVRDHEECANRSYKDIPRLKKHITARHYKTRERVCERCNQTFQAQDDFVAHLKQCPHPPPNRSPTPSTDPEDGIDYRTESILKSRKIVDQISNWTALWGCLFPTDEVVPCPEFEPVVENHDIIYTYERSRLQILQRLDAHAPGPFSEEIKAMLLREVEKLLRCRGSHDQYQTSSSNSSTSQAQYRLRDIDIATVERRSDLAADPPVSSHMAEESEPGGPRPPTQCGIPDSFVVDGVTELYPTGPMCQPLTRYGLSDQSFIGLLPESTQPFREMTRGSFGLTHSNGVDTLQSLTQPQLALFSAGTTSFNQNRFPQTLHDGPWVPNNGYFSSIESNPDIVWPDFSGNFYGNLGDAEC
ncbi:hypothetical protein F4824DRAFT_458265 [Ustulina deusta]|nr:hypothetical protein F4824DRAFT_484763 [Ustulina deusta]KAI3338623.1 hypothetical protein F4824DRAFT_458265 [Ustulina deusta]